MAEIDRQKTVAGVFTQPRPGAVVSWESEPSRIDGRLSVESGCDAVAVGPVCLLPPLSSGGAQVTSPWLRFHIPLSEPDEQISRIRLSDRTSRLHPRRATAKLCQAYKAEVPVQMREWIAPAAFSPDIVLAPQPPT